MRKNIHFSGGGGGYGRERGVGDVHRRIMKKLSCSRNFSEKKKKKKEQKKNII